MHPSVSKPCLLFLEKGKLELARNVCTNSHMQAALFFKPLGQVGYYVVKKIKSNWNLQIKNVMKRPTMGKEIIYMFKP
jgi:hypothetical protein